MNYNQKEPINFQIKQDIKKKIISGEYLPNEKMAPVRELAVLYEVNPNTMQKALSELETEQLLFTRRTAGRFITDDQKRILLLKEEMVKEQIKNFVNEIQSFGIDEETVLKLVRKEIYHE